MSIGIEGRDPMAEEILLGVGDIATQQDRTGLRQADQQRAVA